MTTVHALSRRSIDQLEDAIIDHSKRLNATEYEFLELVREFDIRQGWKAYHFNSCAEWLNLKCGIVVGTAREKVRVAMALFELPGISKSFAAGDLSYSKVRSLSRVATPHNEARLLDYALDATAEQVQTHCQRLRNADRRTSTTDANQIHRERYLSRSLDGSGRMTISVELTQEAGELVMAALERAMSDASRDGSDEESIQARQADALVDMARSYLAGGTEKSTSSAEHYQVVVHVDEAALRETKHEEAKKRSAARIRASSMLRCECGDGDARRQGQSARCRAQAPRGATRVAPCAAGAGPLLPLSRMHAPQMARRASRDALGRWRENESREHTAAL